MKSLLHLAARLYPAAWRHRYGVEYRALLGQMTPTLRNVFNVAFGGIAMQIKAASPTLLAISFGAAGVVTTGAIAYATSHRVESTGTLKIERAGAATTTAPEDLGAELLGLITRALTDDYLATLVDRADIPISQPADASTTRWRVRDLRGNLGVLLIAPGVVRVSYASDSPAHTQGVAIEIMHHFIDAALQEAFEARESGRPREPRTLRVLDPVGSPQWSVSSRRMILAGTCGLGLGVLAGAFVGGRRSRRRSSN